MAVPGEPRFLHELCDVLARVAPDRVVLRDELCTLTGRGLLAAVDDAEAALMRLGIRAGDRVLIAAENSVAEAVAVFALWRIGAWAVLVNARLTQPEIERIARHAGARALLFVTAASPSAARLATAFSASPVTGFDGVSACLDRAAIAEPHDDDPASRVAALIYTSGTTGEPKGVMLTHANLLFVARASGGLRKLGPADTVYGIMPVTHVFGLASVFLGSLAYAAELILVPRFDAAAAARALAVEGVTVFQGAPTMYARFLELAESQGAPLAAPRLRYISAGGAPLDLGLKTRVEAMWRQPLNNGYGMTETSPTVTTTRAESPATDDTVGPALPGVGVRIVDAETLADKSAGDVGEIWLSGPGVMKGYYRAPEETGRVLTADGWYRSGDLGRLDEAGNLYVVGRLKELIIRSGFNVYPPEVEAALALHPDVALVAVVGRRIVDRDGANEEVVAFVEPKAGRSLDVAALASFATQRLAPYKRPMRYVVATLPTTSAGKIRKAELFQQAQQLGGIEDPADDARAKPV